jgi:hypothetical protein
MSESGAQDMVAVTLNAPRALEEQLVDWLLEREDTRSFTSYVAYSHSGRPGKQLSIAEQVSGRQRRIEVRIEVPADAIDGLLAHLESMGGDADLHFTVTPLLRAGHIGT